MPEQARAVFITGAAGGIGAATVRALTAAGIQVYAGVRSGLPDALAGLPGVQPVDCDVTDPGSVGAAAEHVAGRQAGRGLHAVINNAGLIVQGPVELVPPGEWRRQFEVNVFGPALVTQEFLPLLRLGHGRLINVSATSARTTLPFFGPISASKAALESFSDAARVELAPWRIPVVIIEPGATRTTIFDKAAATARTVQDTAANRGLYEQQMHAFNRTMSRQKLSAPEVVAKVIVRAVLSRRPRARYLAGPDARTAALLSHLPMRTRDRVLTRFLGLHRIASPA
ncbi:MAG: short-chain dehydrogenase [Pseudonocardiales bacterium]|nr:MAG: short-chain dehydrogenase [Pseudonocardiales bacterium]